MIGKNCQAFTINYNGIANVLITEAGLSLPFDPGKYEKETKVEKSLAIWDTGATASAITEKMAKDLNLKPTGMTEVRSVHGKENKNVYLINAYLPNKVMVKYVRVTECKALSGNDKLGLLIGMDIIGIGDFVVTNFKKTSLSFRSPALKKVDFVEIARMGERERNAVGRNDPCPCGSKKKYKKCCGK